MKIEMNDVEIEKLMDAEENRLCKNYNLIASENIPSDDVFKALGSKLSIKYSEGEVGKRYYQGNEFIDEIEKICKQRLLSLFNAEEKYSANVQVTSGALSNICVMQSILKNDDKILSLSLNDGAHLSHGSSVHFSGNNYKIINYNLDKNNKIDYDEIEKIAIQEKPKLIICGFTSYPWKFSFKKFSMIAKKSGSLLLADVSHITGLIVTNNFESPIGYADFITSTCQKSLRGPRSAFILMKKEFETQINRSVFPGIFGGPKNNEIAAKAICFKEAKDLKFKKYIDKVLFNTKFMSDECKKLGFNVIGTDTHLFLIDLKNENISAKELATELEENGIVVNVNTIPNSNTEKKYDPVGIRIGLCFETSKNIRDYEIIKICKILRDSVNKLKEKSL